MSRERREKGKVLEKIEVCLDMDKESIDVCVCIYGVSNKVHSVETEWMVRHGLPCDYVRDYSWLPYARELRIWPCYLFFLIQ